MSAIDLPYLFVLGYSGELSVKGKGTRNRFTRRLAKNLRAALEDAGIACYLEATWSRLFLLAASPDAGEVAERVFGVRWVWSAEKRSWNTLEDILEAGEKIYRPRVAGKTFAVRMRRGGESHGVPFRSPEVERALGSRLSPGAAGVDLTHPEVHVQLELRRGDAYFLTDRRPGAGGLPLGTEGRAVALVSGGFDSLVAAWLLLRRGVTLDFVFCNLGGDRHRDAVLEVLQVLIGRWGHGYRPRLHMIEFAPLVREIQTCRQRLWQVLLKRQMLRAADAVVRMSRAAAIVTGEAVGQVSSQTLQNLSVISQATEIPILRPLAATSKEDIVALARRIGTHDLSERIPEYCALDSRQPETHARPKTVLSTEVALDPALLAAAIDERAVFDLKALDLDKMRAPALEVEEIPSRAVVIDLRSEAAFKSWHFPGAIRLGYAAALDACTSLDRDRTHVFYCEVGLKSAHLAEILHGLGGRAHHFKGGLKPLLAYFARRDKALAATISPVLLND